MNVEGLVGLLNFLSRWFLFVTVAYKAYRTKEKAWILISSAFFISAFDVESYILKPLGIVIIPDAYRVASKISNFFMATLLLWGAVHLKHGVSTLKHVTYLAVFLVASYLWLFLSATVLLEDPRLRAVFPSLAYAGALIYLGLVLNRYVVSKHITERLFPYGLILLGVLNLTYPVTRFLSWFAPIGFFMGAFFRVMAAIGAFRFVFYPVEPVEPVEETSTPGAFMIPSDNSSKLREITSRPGTIILTREDLRHLIDSVNRHALIFWITRIKDGKIQDSPTVYAMSPTRIDVLTDLIAKAVEQGYRTVYVDCLEYLILENGFERAMRFLLNVKDRVISAGGTVILAINLDTLDEKQRRILKKEFEIRSS